MNRLRTRSLVAFGSAALLLVSTSSAFAARPVTAPAASLHVSAPVHQSVADIEDPTTEPTDDPADTTDATDSSAHGACVSAVAKSDAVGGKNNNHGGAVSEAARVTCWEPAVPPVVTDPTAGDAGSTDVSAMTTTRSHGSGHGATRRHGG